MVTGVLLMGAILKLTCTVYEGIAWGLDIIHSALHTELKCITLDIRRHGENAPSWLPYHTAFLSQELEFLIPLHGTVLPFLALSGCKCNAYTSTHINKSFIAATTTADLYNHTTGQPLNILSSLPCSA